MTDLLKTRKYFIFLSFSIYITVFIAFYIYHKKSIYIDDKYLLYFGYFLLSLVLGTILSRKYSVEKLKNFFSFKRSHITSYIISLGILSIILFTTELENISRFVLTSSLLSAFVIDYTIFRLVSKKEFIDVRPKGVSKSLFVFLSHFLIFSWLMGYILLSKYDLGFLIEHNSLLLFSLGFCWIVAGWLTSFFDEPDIQQNYFAFIWKYVKGYIYLLALSGFFLFLLRQDPTLREDLFFGYLLYAFLSWVTMTLLYVNKKPRKTDEVSPSLFRAPTLPDINFNGNSTFTDTKYFIPPLNGHSPLLRKKLENVYLKKFPEVTEFLEEKLDLDRIDLTRSVILRSGDPYNVEVLPENELELYMNLHELNDIRRINSYFIEVNKRLVEGGVYVGMFEPIRYRYERFQKNYPYFIGRIFYFLDFIWKRVFPKIPVIKKVYFALTKGRDRALSISEGLGRLQFCGFDIIDMKHIDHFLYFTAKKSRVPREDKDPSYGPLFKMKRIGKDGKPIHVYKFRTMHPYSEYIQKLSLIHI